MTKEESAYWLPLITALAEGKTIQFNYSGTGWANVDSIETHRDPSLYRVRPEPREFCIRIEKNGVQTFWQVDLRDSVPTINTDELQVIHVREVLSE